MGMNSAVLEMIWIARQLFWKTDTDLTAFWCSFAERVILTCQLLPVDGIFLTFSNKILKNEVYLKWLGCVSLSQKLVWLTHRPRDKQD